MDDGHLLFASKMSYEGTISGSISLDTFGANVTSGNSSFLSGKASDVPDRPSTEDGLLVNDCNAEDILSDVRAMLERLSAGDAQFQSAIVPVSLQNRFPNDD